MPLFTNSSAPPQGVPEAPVDSYEKSDLAVKAVFAFIFFFFISGIVIHLFTGWHLSKLRKGPSPADVWTGAKANPRWVGPAPQFPRLQVSPPSDLNAFRAREEAELNSYGWLNKTAGVVRIPIERAMDLLLAKGLPTRSATNESSLGKSSLQLQQERPLHAEPGGERGK